MQKIKMYHEELGKDVVIEITDEVFEELKSNAIEVEIEESDAEKTLELLAEQERLEEKVRKQEKRVGKHAAIPIFQ